MLIEVEHVSHTYAAGTPAANPVLHDLDLRLSEHRIGIIGANGSGKSTFVRLLDALARPTAGRILVNGHDTATQAAAVRRQTGFLFTDPDNQIIMPSVREDVAFGLRRLKLPKDEAAARVEAQLALFGLTALAEAPAHLLSGGQKQVLSLAAVLVVEPALLIMDEPTTLLDLRHSAMFADLVATLEQPVIMATHHLDLVAGFDRVLCFEAGRVVADGAPDEVVAFYRELMAAPPPKAVS